MPLVTTIKTSPSNPSTTIYILHITETASELLSLLPRHQDRYTKQLQAFSSENRKKEWLAIRILLHHIAGQQDLIQYDEYGKPSLGEGAPQLSISHTKAYAALALSASPIGIDIERWSHRAFRLHSKFLNNSEYSALGHDPQRMALIFWSLKEAAYKLLQNKEHTLIKDVSINTEADHFLLVLDKEEARGYYKDMGDFVLTWAMK